MDILAITDLTGLEIGWRRGSVVAYSSDLAFSESRHFIREVNPANTMAYDKPSMKARVKLNCCQLARNDFFHCFSAGTQYRPIPRKWILPLLFGSRRATIQLICPMLPNKLNRLKEDLLFGPRSWICSNNARVLSPTVASLHCRMLSHHALTCSASILGAFAAWLFYIPFTTVCTS